jgi:prepilin-type N-terminal cleavage/methylation domain-containing protein
MDFKNTSIEGRCRGRRGMTLVEVLVSIGIGGVVMVAVASLTFYTARSFVALANYEELDRLSRRALDEMTYKVRQADGMTSLTGDTVTFSLWGTNTLTYTYNPSTRLLTEKLGSVSTVLLEECDSFAFKVYSRNPVAGTFDQFPVTTDAAGAKLFQVSWTCSRQIMGQKVNTESVQSAKIVIRKS